MTSKALINVRLHCPGHSTHGIIRDNLITLISGLKELISITWKDSSTVEGLNCRKTFLVFPTELSESAEVP